MRADRKITDLLGNRRFTLSAEITPPRDSATAQLIAEQMNALTQAGAQFLSVSKGAGGFLPSEHIPIAELIEAALEVPYIAHLTCRDFLPEEVEDELIELNQSGVRNVLALRGDPPLGVANWTPSKGSHTYAYQLIEQIRAMNEASSTDRTDFCISAACYPDHENTLDRMEYFIRKVEAGAHYAISQMMFSADSYGRFIEDCAASGVHIPVIPGSRILRSREHAARVQQRFGVPIPGTLMNALPSESEVSPDWRYSIDAFTKLGEDFKRAGAPGFHLFVMNDLEPAQEVFRRLSKISSQSC